MSKPVFSIIIPTLNEAKCLPHLLEDLVGQTFQDFEVIVVDGLSTDKTLELANSFKSRLDLKVITSSRRHVCTQRNQGASTAHADLLVFSDADNRLPPYFLQGIKYRIDSAPADITTTWFKPDVSSPSNDLISLVMNLGMEIQNNIHPRFVLESMIIFKRSSFIKMGGFDENSNFAEGNQLIQKSIKFNLSLATYRDPAYTYSFRRFRKFGTLKVLQNTAQLGLIKFLGENYKNQRASELYPMLGGSLFSKNRNIKNKFLKSISQLLKDF